MLKILSTVVNSGGVSDAVSGDGKPGGFVEQQKLDSEVIVTIIILCIISFVFGIIVEKIIRFFKDCKEINEEYKKDEEENE